MQRLQAYDTWLLMHCYQVDPIGVTMSEGGLPPFRCGEVPASWSLAACPSLVFFPQQQRPRTRWWSLAGGLLFLLACCAR